jgi:hypothetical protein
LYQLTENAVVVGTEHNLHASSAGIAIAATGRERNWRVQLDTLVTATATNSAILEKYPPATILIEQSSSQQQQRKHQTKVIDVYGQQTEPICSYRRCHHKFSVHGYGNHNCKCRHPLNYATGVSLLPLTKEKRLVL